MGHKRAKALGSYFSRRKSHRLVIINKCYKYRWEICNAVLQII